MCSSDLDKLITVTQAGKSIPVFYGMEGQDFFMDQVENLGLRGSRARLHTPQGATEVMIPILCRDCRTLWKRQSSSSTMYIISEMKFRYAVLSG